MFDITDYENAKGCLVEIKEKMSCGDRVEISSDILWEISRLLNKIVADFEKEN